MNKKIVVAILLSGLILVAMIAGCNQTGSSTGIQGNEPAVGSAGSQSPDTTVKNPAVPGADAPKPTKEESTKIADVLSKPDAYTGQEVIIEGKIVSECGSGCWFTLQDNTGTIYIDLAPNNLVIPQKRGANAKAYGEVVNKDGNVYLNGKKVEF